MDFTRVWMLPGDHMRGQRAKKLRIHAGGIVGGQWGCRAWREKECVVTSVPWVTGHAGGQEVVVGKGDA